MGDARKGPAAGPTCPSDTLLPCPGVSAPPAAPLRPCPCGAMRSSCCGLLLQQEQVLLLLFKQGLEVARGAGRCSAKLPRLKTSVLAKDAGAEPSGGGRLQHRSTS